MTLRTLNYGNYGIVLILGNAGFCPSTVSPFGALTYMMFNPVKLLSRLLLTVASLQGFSVHSFQSWLGVSGFRVWGVWASEFHVNSLLSTIKTLGLEPRF